MLQDGTFHLDSFQTLEAFRVLAEILDAEDSFQVAVLYFPAAIYSLSVSGNLKSIESGEETL
jgi:hypothetical protein